MYINVVTEHLINVFFRATLITVDRGQTPESFSKSSMTAESQSVNDSFYA